MSDDNRPISIEVPHTPTGIFEHLCEHHGCREWGGWGFFQRQGHGLVLL
jgi:hypothetical protein